MYLQVFVCKRYNIKQFYLHKRKLCCGSSRTCFHREVAKAVVKAAPGVHRDRLEAVMPLIDDH